MSTTGHRPNSVSELLTYGTLRLECYANSGDPWVGTGFIFRMLQEGGKNVPVIVTNRHVVQDPDTLTMANRTVFYAHGMDAQRNPDSRNNQWVSLEVAIGRNCVLHPDPRIDLAAICFGEAFNALLQNGKEVYYTYLDRSSLPTENEREAFAAVENILMVGYPTGLWDRVNNQPITRRGVTATPIRNDYDGRPEFLVDLPSFEGSSGSPVFLYDTAYQDSSGLASCRARLIGVLSEGFDIGVEGRMQRTKARRRIPVTDIHIGIGVAIKAQQILGLEVAVSDMIDQLSRPTR